MENHEAFAIRDEKFSGLAAEADSDGPDEAGEVLCRFRFEGVEIGLTYHTGGRHVALQPVQIKDQDPVVVRVKDEQLIAALVVLDPMRVVDDGSCGTRHVRFEVRLAQNVRGGKAWPRRYRMIPEASVPVGCQSKDASAIEYDERDMGSGTGGGVRSRWMPASSGPAIEPARSDVQRYIVRWPSVGLKVWEEGGGQ